MEEYYLNSPFMNNYGPFVLMIPAIFGAIFLVTTFIRLKERKTFVAFLGLAIVSILGGAIGASVISNVKMTLLTEYGHKSGVMYLGDQVSLIKFKNAESLPASQLDFTTMSGKTIGSMYCKLSLRACNEMLVKNKDSIVSEILNKKYYVVQGGKYE